MSEEGIDKLCSLLEDMGKSMKKDDNWGSISEKDEKLIKKMTDNIKSPSTRPRRPNYRDRFKFRFFEKKTKTLYQWDEITIEKDYVFIEDGADYVSFENGVLIQCTGLKDKNGKLIYEGDIVNSWAGLGDIYNRLVVQDEDIPILRFEPETGNFLCRNECKNFEIIGNKFKNPELLKK